MGPIEIVEAFVLRVDLFSKDMESAGAPIVIHEWYRGPEQQETAYKKGASKARFGSSAHNYYLAVDYHFLHYGWKVPAAWWYYGDTIARQYGLVSGVNYGDGNHIELEGWKTWKSLFV